MKKPFRWTPCFFFALTFFYASGWAITPNDEPAVKVIQQVQPCVVNINTENIVRQYVTDPYSLFFRRYQLANRTVHNLGSGLLVSPEGYIVTNHHVVQMSESTKIHVTLSNGGVYEAQVISSDPDQDLALIKISDQKPFPFLSLATLSPQLLGQTVIVLGNPVGYENSVSMGILSAKNRTFTSEGFTMEGLLQTDAAINPGNSGGPLIDISGNLVGISTAKFAGTAIEGIGFAIPAETVVPWVNDAIAVAKGLKPASKPVSLADVLRQKFGFTLIDLTPELAQKTGFRTNGGMLVTDVQSFSPAEVVGIKRGMLIVGMGNYPVVNEHSLPRDVTRIKAGEKVRFTIVTVETNGSVVRQRGGSVIITAR